MFFKFLQHLKDKGLTKEAESLRNLHLAGKTYQKKTAGELEWLLPAIKHQDRKITYQDIRDYYTTMQRQLRIPGSSVLGFWNDKIEPFQFNGTLNDHIESKLLGLHHLYNEGKSKNVCIDIIPGKDVDASRVRRNVKRIVELLSEVPTLLSKQIVFDGDKGYHVFGILKDVEDLKILRQVLLGLFTDYCAEHKNVALGEGKDDEIVISLDNMRNMGSFPVPYTLNPRTGLVILPVDNIEDFNFGNAEMKEVLKRFQSLMETDISKEEIEEEEIEEDNYIEASSRIRTLSAGGDFDPSKVSSTSANIGNVHIDSKLDVKKIKDALKHVQETDTNAFGKVRDFDYIISDLTAKEVGITVPAGAAAWFMPHYSDVCFVKKDIVSSKSIEELATILVHEAQHGRYPGYGEWTAESAEVKFQQAKIRTTMIKVVKGSFSRQDLFDYARDFAQQADIPSEEIVAAAKMVPNQMSYEDFKNKYMPRMGAGEERDTSNVLAAYALPIAKVVNDTIYKEVDPNIAMDILSNVLYDPEKRYGTAHALMMYSPEKRGKESNRGTSLNTFIFQTVNWDIRTALEELFGKKRPKSKSLSEGVGGDDESEGRELAEMVGKHDSDEEIERVATEMIGVMDILRDTVSTWNPEAADAEVIIGNDLRRSVRLYDTSKQAVEMFNYYLLTTGLLNLDEFAGKQPVTTKEELLASRGFSSPSAKCLDCGQRYKFEKDWGSKISRLESEGCRKKKDAPEHQIGWTDGIYNVDVAGNLGYQYRLGFERQTTGSNEQEPVIAKLLRGLSVFAVNLEDLEEERPKRKLPTMPSLSLKDVEDVQRETEKVKEVQVQKKEYTKSLNPNSYESKRLQGRNLEIVSPRESSQVIDDNEIEQLVSAFKDRLESKGSTKKRFTEFKELGSELIQLRVKAAHHERTTEEKKEEI